MDQVEEIKSKVDIVEIISGYVPMKKAGRNFKANCPFHGEKTPSFMVNPELQIYKCFGCGEGGDVYSFLEKMEGMTFGEALKYLADRVGVRLTSYKPSRDEEERERLLKINKLVADAYHYLLTKHNIGKKALDYLLGRGVKIDMIKKFNLGFSPESWSFLTEFIVTKKKYSQSDLIRLGLVVEGRNYDRFRNRIMFPLNNNRGDVVGFAGRVLPGGDEKVGGKYINSPETEIYHKSELLYGFDISRSEIKKSGQAIVVEGELDAICTFQTGILNVVAIKGSALTEKQIELLRRVTDRLILALDADMAGNMAARRGIEMAEKMGMYIETVNWNNVVGIKDAADLAVENPEKLREVINNPISIYSFIIDTAIKKFGLTAEGKSRIANDVLPLILQIRDEIRKDEYIKELAHKTQTDLDVIRKQIGRLQSTGIEKTKEKTVENKTEIERGENLEQYLVGLVLRYDKREKLAEITELFKTIFWKKVVTEICKGKRVDSLPEELKSKVSDLILMEDPDNLDFDKEWSKGVDLLRQVRSGKRILYIENDVDS